MLYQVQLWPVHKLSNDLGPPLCKMDFADSLCGLLQNGSELYKVRHLGLYINRQTILGLNSVKWIYLTI